ncbi:hypothetical protein NPIL_237121 [Nephila pilipes]|uniref:Uncharacterized protein n=1 Tax=Nephila pilipes TaxID=299642 RepID=A0A8X6TWS6_NEPPI|nr:hypothetical protein NPIL_588601 [Nephila pilipes]GFT55050.1 hypothetical protein NPIL_237121 [Nephila pilipes]
MEKKEFLNSIVTGNETWNHHFSSETKLSFLEWNHSTSPTRTKCEFFHLRKDYDDTVFDKEDVVHTEFLPKGATIKASS